MGWRGEGEGAGVRVGGLGGWGVGGGEWGGGWVGCREEDIMFRVQSVGVRIYGSGFRV